MHKYSAAYCKALGVVHEKLTLQAGYNPVEQILIGTSKKWTEMALHPGPYKRAARYLICYNKTTSYVTSYNNTTSREPWCMRQRHISFS